MNQNLEQSREIYTLCQLLIRRPVSKHAERVHQLDASSEPNQRVKLLNNHQFELVASTQKRDIKHLDRRSIAVEAM